MTDEQLQRLVEEISMTSFGRPFLHRATFNKRLRSTGGRYFTQTHHIDISRRQYEAYGVDEIEKIIKHELCHYHLHLAKQGYQHRDPAFKALLQQVGGSRFCQPLPDASSKPKPYRYALTCRQCRMVYKRKRKVDVRKYACGRCGGSLDLRSLTIGGSGIDSIR